jgi:sugar lactone lactonase YvrE
MYYIDSPTHRVDAFDFDLESGDVSRRRQLVAFPEAWGFPDGMAVDAEGFLWVAFWGGSAVRRIDPEGRVRATVRFPVSQVSSCAFGGAGLGDLYVTSARNGLSPRELEREPQAGAVFRVRVDVRGRPAHPFAG